MNEDKPFALSGHMKMPEIPDRPTGPRRNVDFTKSEPPAEEPPPEEKPWDHEFEWEKTTNFTAPMPANIDERLREAVTDGGGRIAAFAIMMEMCGGWIAGECGPQQFATDHVTEDSEYMEDDDEVQIKFGWAVPGACERLPETDGC